MQTETQDIQLKTIRVTCPFSGTAFDAIILTDWTFAGRRFVQVYTPFRDAHNRVRTDPRFDWQNLQVICVEVTS